MVLTTGMCCSIGAISSIARVDATDTKFRFEALSSLSDNGSSKAIAVPSRLYHAAPSIRKPLSGVRISITDAASLKGVQTTLSSRAWSQLYGTEASETAEFVQKLIDMGAIIVGKTKSSQLDSGREWVDVAAPWNPRGDGYQDSGGSAAGAGASIGGYDWMEYAIAKDCEYSYALLVNNDNT